MIVQWKLLVDLKKEVRERRVFGVVYGYQTDVINASHIITDIYVTGNIVNGTNRILNTKFGNMVNDLLKEGFVPQMIPHIVDIDSNTRYKSYDQSVILPNNFNIETWNISVK